MTCRRLEGRVAIVTSVTLAVDGGLSIQSAAALLRPGLRRGWRFGRLELAESAEMGGSA